MGQLEGAPPWGERLAACLAQPWTHRLRAGLGQVEGLGQVPRPACAAPAPAQQRRRLQLLLQQQQDPCLLRWVCGAQWACCLPPARLPWVGLQASSWAPGLTCCALQDCRERLHRAGCCCCWAQLLQGLALTGCSALFARQDKKTPL